MQPETDRSHASIGRFWTRRDFLKAAAAGSAGLACATPVLGAGSDRLNASDLPKGSAPAALALGHFPDRVHAFVWRNWSLAPLERMAEVLGAPAREVRQLGTEMGLPPQPEITADQQRRSYITVIRRNWHLLAYDQLLQLLGWTPEQMAFTLREDDFLYVKLGNLKPQCEPLKWGGNTDASRGRREKMASQLREVFGQPLSNGPEPLFRFVNQLSRTPTQPATEHGAPKLSPRFCYSYFALYGDPLLDEAADPYPEGYLAQLAQSGVDGVWLQGVLNKLTPFPWDNTSSLGHEQRLARLKEITVRAARHGIRVYLYLNEPRSMPASFFEKYPELKGVTEGEFSALCTSHPDVQRWMVQSVAAICKRVPDLGGFFTITASENLTNCWSHNGGARCPRCSKRSPASVIAEVNTLVHRGISEAGTDARLIAWDWGWADGWTPEAIDQLPSGVALMSVSEWSLPLERGGVKNTVGEYSISAIGPGPRAKRHWALARQRGLKAIAKIQAGNTWELSAVPYIPALENVARHAAGLLDAQVDGLMLGWTLGGYPSPNLEIVMEVARTDQTSAAREAGDRVQSALQRVAVRRYGPIMASSVVEAWTAFSAAFREFPYDGGVVYNAPLQCGPSNLLWAKPTGYRATMVGIPYDDLDSWRGPYPPDVFIAQLEKVAEGFEKALGTLRKQFAERRSQLSPDHERSVTGELGIAHAAAVHFRSVANQARYVRARQVLASAKPGADAAQLKAEMKRVLNSEIELSRELYEIQSRDSRIGFEATNHYYYVPFDLAEKILNCRQLLEDLD